MIIDVTQEDVIDYCGTWFRSNCKGLVAMFVDLKYISNDSNSKDDGEVNGDEGVIDIGLIGTMEEVVLPMNEVKAFDDLESSSVPLEGALVRLHQTMKEITEECTQGGVALCEHVTSIMKVVASKIQNIRLTKTNESLHLGMLLHCVDDGLRYSVHSLKDWHETMFTHINVCKKRSR
jgi:hypothetical protein